MFVLQVEKTNTKVNFFFHCNFSSREEGQRISGPYKVLSREPIKSAHGRARGATTRLTRSKLGGGAIKARLMFYSIKIILLTARTRCTSASISANTNVVEIVIIIII